MIRLILIVCCLVLSNGINGDKPCAARTTTEESVVCVCNATYCDEYETDIPEKNSFVSYTTSKSGLRLKKTIGVWNTVQKTGSHVTIRLDPSTKYQEIEGFGGSVTDSAGINWKSLKTEKLQQSLIDSYFSERGLQYNMIRVPIGGSDFSTHAYAYNELPENDTELSNYTLAPEDFKFKIPMIKAAMSASKTRLHIIASTWSPGLWMKTNRQYGGFSRLKPEFFQTYALYHLKFLQKYMENGVPIWGITTTNEPSNGLYGLVAFNSLGWTIDDMGQWISTNLGPTIRNSIFKDVKIMAGDDQRFTLPYWYDSMVTKVPEVLDYIDGYAVHFYADQITSPSVLDFIAQSQPDKFVISTEASEGFANPWRNEKVSPGSWQKAKNYVTDIIQDLNHNVIGWIDWNLCLDSQGGPNWVNNFVDSPITVYPDDQEFIKQPMFYGLAHFSRFIPRGSRRIGSEISILPSHVQHIAFVTPRRTIAVVIYNNACKRDVSIKLNQKQAYLSLEPDSVTTVELRHKLY